MDAVQKHNHCINIPSSQVYRAYQETITPITVEAQFEAWMSVCIYSVLVLFFMSVTAL
jgi:hypothetical protein